MNTARRKFLKAGGMMSLAAAFSGRLTAIAFGQNNHTDLGSGLGHVVPKEALADPLALITKSMFTSYLNSKFSFLRNNAFLADLVLIGVKDQSPVSIKGSTRESFALVFQGPSSPKLKQATYLVRHQRLGSFQLFIVPASPVALRGPHYEAVVNRMFP